MSVLVERWAKLRGRSFDELRVRGTQAMAASAERLRWSEQARLPGDASLFERLDRTRLDPASLSAEGLLALFRTRTSPRFAGAFAEPEGTLRELRRRWPGEVAATVEHADRIVDGSFDLLGRQDLRFGEPVDWHLDPVSGRRSPLVHWSRIDYLDPVRGGDTKLVWELNRHQHFVTLGRAYWYTGDERYASSFAVQVTAWMEANPPKQGINWASSLEVAFRAISWLWALYLFRSSAALTPRLYLQILKFLYLHARHLETYLSTYSSPNTHLTGEALGLFYLGTLLPEFWRSRRWLASGRRILINALERHVQPDGVYFEQSTCYHRYTTDFYLHFLVLGRANRLLMGPGEEVLVAKMTALLDHLMSITRPDGTTPLVGDDDGGRLVLLDERPPNDFRAALSTGAALFSRPDYKHVAGEAAAETAWLLGQSGLERFDRLEARRPAMASRAFSHSGFYLMRDGWKPDACYLLLRCGSHGALNGGHAHADALAFDLAAGGRPLLVDPGTYTYTRSTEERDRFRSSPAHNTLVVDGQSSSVPAGPFAWKHTAQAYTHAWISRPRFDYFQGSHDGYHRLTPPVMHTRSVLFLKGGYWVVRDHVVSVGPHRYELRFHFTPEACPRVETEHGATAVREWGTDGAGIEIVVLTKGGGWHQEEGWVSPSHGKRERASVLSFVTHGTGEHEFFTFLLPLAANSPRVSVREIEATSGSAFEIREGGRRDLLMTGSFSSPRPALTPGPSPKKLGEGGHARPPSQAPLSQSLGEPGTRAAGGGVRSRTECPGLMTARDGAARLPGMVSDADWAWVRFGEDQTTPRECVLIDGSYLLLHGQRVVATSERAGYIVACVAGDGTRIDTDARGPLKGELTQGHASPAIEWPHRVDRDKVAYVRD